MNDVRRVAAFLFALGFLLICGAGVRLRVPKLLEPSTSARTAPGGGDRLASNERALFDPELLNKTVEFWAKQAKRDSQGALERRELASAYLARQRATGDIADAVKAEQTARESFKILPQSNSAALITLARSLLTQHRFPEALEVAQRVAAFDPRARRLVGDVQIELGEYDAAKRSLAESPPEPNDLNYYALRARLEAVDGNPGAVIALLRKADRLVTERTDMPVETIAWYHVTLGHALVESGQLEAGESACKDALTVFPLDYRAMTVIAEAAFWRGDWRGTIEWAEKAVALSRQNPTALKLLADAYAATGRQDEADRYTEVFRQLAHSFPRIYDRNWALYCADNGRDLDEALTLARDDLKMRHDIHAYDTLAWVYFKKGMLIESEAAMQSALGRGTRQATLYYHAGMIARAVGNPERAKTNFTLARELNPHSIPIRWVRWLDSAPAATVSSPPQTSPALIP